MIYCLINKLDYIITINQELLRQEERKRFIIASVLISLLVIMIVFIISFFIKEHKKRNNPDSFEIEEYEAVERNAIILKKEVSLVQTGSYIEPSHGMQYEILARFDDGKEKVYRVPEEFYDNIPLHTTGTLVLANDEFVDFQI